MANRFTLLMMCFGAAAALNAQVIYSTNNGTRLVAKVTDGQLTVFDGGNWNSRFWTGVNTGVTTPGHFPGELSVTRDQYARWFPQMKAMNVRVLRVYTILPPDFYQALVDFNRTQNEPLWVLHGIWAPEEELIGADEQGRNAFTPDIVATFRSEIIDAVAAVHGNLNRAPRPGHASGSYTADISPYLLGWLVGTEWYPLAVQRTNADAAGQRSFEGAWFRAHSSASPFENWLAQMLEYVAAEEMKYGWQHPISFVNWVTTDPLRHPAEPNPAEDMVSVDPLHIQATDSWLAGYFASYHIYPYYPDFLRYNQAYQQYRDANGNINPYAAYLHELRAYHKGLPLFVGEFGVPTSRGLAHIGVSGWNQGAHTEREQGEIVSSMLESIHSEGYDGAILFTWQDEWYKATWNTAELEQPFDRRPLWLNRLTNERFFGLLAMDPASEGGNLTLDGHAEDWQALQKKSDWQFPAVDISVTHDEAFLHLLVRKRSGKWDFTRDQLYLGFSTLSGGSRTSDQAPGLAFSQSLQFLLRMRGDNDARWFVSSAYDQHTFRWGFLRSVIPSSPAFADPSQGIFLPWKLLLNRPLTLPASGETVPAEEVEIGVLRRGTNSLSAADHDDLADWQTHGQFVEIRIPWMLLGFMDPSDLRVWEWPYVANRMTPVPVSGVKIEPKLVTDGSEIGDPAPVAFYQWTRWDQPLYRERLKASYGSIGAAMGKYHSPVSPGR